MPTDDGRNRPGSKAPPKARKLSAAERKRRKRGRAKSPHQALTSPYWLCWMTSRRSWDTSVASASSRWRWLRT